MDLNHYLEILSEVSELKLNDIKNQITSIHAALRNIVSSHKPQNDCPKISSNQDIDEVKFLREELRNKNNIINTLLENIFLITRSFLLIKSWKIIIKITFKIINLKLLKDTDLKSGSHPQKKLALFALKMIKNTFYFIEKAFFVLKIFLS